MATNKAQKPSYGQPKPKSPDGIWLDRRGNDTNWALFSEQFMDYALRTYGSIAQELGADDDIDEQVDEPEGDPNGWQYRMTVIAAQEAHKINRKNQERRVQLFGDILCHVCLESERLVKEHVDYNEAFVAKSPRLLWDILRDSHMAPAHVGDMGMWIQRGSMHSLRQGQQRIEDYGRRFRLEYEKLLALEGQMGQEEAAQIFLTSLDGNVFSTLITDWVRDDEVPTTLNEAILRTTAWYRTTMNAKQAMGGTPHTTSTPTLRPAAAFASTTEEDAPPEKCPICKKLANHSLENCWELQAFAERAKANGNGKRPEKQEKRAARKQTPHSKGAKTPGKGQHGWAIQGTELLDDDETEWDKAEREYEYAAGWSARPVSAAHVFAALQRGSTILDSGASLNIWSDETQLESTRQGQPTAVHGVNGIVTSTTWGTHSLFGEGIVVPSIGINLVSLSAIKKSKSADVLFASETNEFRVTIPGQDPIIFGHKGGVYAMNHEKVGLVALPSYSKREVEKAHEARALCKRFGHIGTGGLLRIVASGSVIDLDISAKDIRRADALLGPCASCAVGKGTKPSGNYTHFQEDDPRVPVDEEPEQLHADLIFIPGPGRTKHLVMLSVGERTRLLVATKAENKTSSCICSAWKDHLVPYECNGVKVTTISTDNEANLGATQAFLATLGVKLIQHASEAHEPYIERRVRTIRERMRCILHDLQPLFKLPARLYYYLLEWVIQSINFTPDTLGGTDLRSAREIVTGQRLKASALSTSFGECVLYHSEAHGSNNLQQRNDFGIIVGRRPEAGIVRIWNPSTHATVERRAFRRMPYPDTLLATINAVAARDKDVQLDEDITRLQPTDVLPVHLEANEAEPALEPALDQDPTDLGADGPELARVEESPAANEDVPAITTPPEPAPIEGDTQGNIDGDASDQGATEPSIGENDKPYNLRPRKPRHQDDAFAYVQLSSTEATTKYPEAGPAAIKTELQNLLDYGTFEPAEQSLEGTRPLPCRLFVKVKTKPDGSFDRLKGRIVAGGHRQHDVEDTSSPTIAWETFLLALATAASNELKLAIVDIPSAYLNAKGSGKVLMLLPPDVTKLLIEIRPSWKSYQRPNGGMVVRVLKALYGLKDSGQLWYQHLVGTLARLGFKACKQDPCLFTRKIGSKLDALVLAYVDDLAIFSRSAENIKSIIASLETTYGKLAPQYGPRYAFVGTEIVFENGNISLNCAGYIRKLAAEFQVTHPATTPTPSDYTGKVTAKEDSPTDPSRFRSLVMSLMYVAKRCRPDILVNASFYSTKIQEPAVVDLKAALRTLRYLLRTAELGLQFKDSNTQLYLSADAAHNVHNDAKSHTGLAIIASGAPVLFKSSKQKLIAKSSTEAEMIACDQGVDLLLHVSELAAALGLKVTSPLIIHQDNMSSIFIMERGRPTKKRGPINVRFEYVKDLIDRGIIKLEHTRTHCMISDMLTKMLHGESFHQGAKAILGLSE